MLHLMSHLMSQKVEIKGTLLQIQDLFHFFMCFAHNWNISRTISDRKKDKTEQ